MDCMKSLLPATLIGFLIVAYAESTAQIKGKQSSVVAEEDMVVEWVLDNYSSIESWFAGAENVLRTSDVSIIETLDEFAELVSDREIQSEGKKKQLITLKEKLEARKQKIEMVMKEETDSSMLENWGSALKSIELKLEGKIKPLLDSDFQYLEKFDRDLFASMLKWKQYLDLVNGVAPESVIRNKLAGMISAHFSDKVEGTISERREKWGSAVKPQKEPVQKEQIDGGTSFVDNLPKSTEERSPKHINPVNPQDEPVQKVEKNVGGARFLDNIPSPAPRFEMILVKPGSFAMGSPGGFFAGERGRDSDESQHQVTLTKGFYLAKYEVTQAQWVHVMGSNPSQFKGANRPVEEVSWNDAVAFCKKLTEMERRGGRLPADMAYQLPTEAQWEYVCRSGTTSAFSFGQDLTSRQANISGGPAETTEVGKYPANAWGLHDMHGNVWEWCADWYAEYPKGGDTDPTGSMKGSTRVTRGGSWDDSASDARCSSRNSRAPAGSYGGLGFRLSLQPTSR